MDEDDHEAAVLIEPGKRYLLARPCGGFNDCLVQLDAARRHAERFGRTLVIDTNLSGLKAGFETLFETRPNFGCPVILWSPEIGAALDRIPSVQPAELTHRITSYQSAYDDETWLHRDTQTNALTSVDLERDHPETLLIQERAGGGIESLRILRRVSLRTEVATEIAARLSTLGTDYDAIHIRHSDYRTDFEGFLQRISPIFAGRKLLVCTDSAEVKEAAPHLLGTSVEVISIAEPPDTNGRPLHDTELADRHAANLDLVTEIIAMARAQRFVFTQLDRTHLNWKFSGFAKLVAAIRAAPDTLDILFANCDMPSQKTSRSGNEIGSRKSAVHTMIRRQISALQMQWWNRKAIRETRKIRRRVAKDLL
ncbi:MAG: hypothetical protein H5U24_13760 [Thioclava marina]|uniref:hypothetical protein n=1 Tax=Thioclava marina TaxID=1915077 RepID=UPI00199F2945|nr:hypothetical protein [Thioclava marina]MBC7146450.1 hypothetical protein [Thioclava marina]